MFTQRLAEKSVRLLELSGPLGRQACEQRIAYAVCVSGMNVHVLDQAKPKDHSVENVDLHVKSCPRESQLVDADRWGYAIDGIYELRRDGKVGDLQR